MRNFTALFLFMFLVCTTQLFPNPTLAQTSIGYEDPSDISNLMEYRLPDWSYRVWDADFSLSGHGNEERRAGDFAISNYFTTNLGSRYQQNWESEKRLMTLGCYLDGDYEKSHLGTETRETKYHDLDVEFTLSGSVENYLATSPFFAKLSGYFNHSYREKESEGNIDIPWENSTDISRAIRQYIFAGFGYGKIRNVVPLLRAQRLSERLTAMGRPALSGQQITEIAQILAKDYGYREVFDRDFRHFWDDVLAPMLDQDNPLTPFEIFYLNDVMNEQFENRMQGFKISVGFRYLGYDYYLNGLQNTGCNQNASMDISWSHNLSLTQQIYFSGNYYYSWNNNYNEHGSLILLTGYLWNLADRYSLDTTLNYATDTNIFNENSNETVALNSNFRIYLEDRISINTTIGLEYEHVEYNENEYLGWKWTYRLGLTYHLDRAIF